MLLATSSSSSSWYILFHFILVCWGVRMTLCSMQVYTKWHIHHLLVLTLTRFTCFLSYSFFFLFSFSSTFLRRKNKETYIHTYIYTHSSNSNHHLEKKKKKENKMQQHIRQMLPVRCTKRKKRHKHIHTRLSNKTSSFLSFSFLLFWVWLDRKAASKCVRSFFFFPFQVKGILLRPKNICSTNIGCTDAAVVAISFAWNSTWRTTHTHNTNIQNPWSWGIALNRSRDSGLPMHPILGTVLPSMTVLTAISTFLPLIVYC